MCLPQHSEPSGVDGEISNEKCVPPYRSVRPSSTRRPLAPPRAACLEVYSCVMMGMVAEPFFSCFSKKKQRNKYPHGGPGASDGLGPYSAAARAAAAAPTAASDGELGSTAGWCTDGPSAVFLLQPAGPLHCAVPVRAPSASTYFLVRTCNEQKKLLAMTHTTTAGSASPVVS